MTLPLILQIQQAALDSTSSVTDALRKAKIACAKLGLTEFENWVDLELGGYIGKPGQSLPKYRLLHGIPKAYSPYQGWEPIIFHSTDQLESWSVAPVGMTISALETFVRGATVNGEFHFPLPPEAHRKLMQSLNWGPSDIQVALTVPTVADIIDAVRNILLNWTLDIEKSGVFGDDLLFSEDERLKSASVTAQTVNNFHIGQIGAFAQNAENSVVQGGVESVLNLDGMHDLVKQVEQLLPAADVPTSVKEDTAVALAELKEAADSSVPDRGRLRRALEGLKRVVAPAGEHLLRIGVDTASHPTSRRRIATVGGCQNAAARASMVIGGFGSL